MRSSRAKASVIELNPYIIEPNPGQRDAKLGVNDRTLWCSCKQVSLGSVGVHLRSETSCKSGDTRVSILLDVKIKSIDHIVAKWSRTSISARLRTKDLP